MTRLLSVRLHGTPLAELLQDEHGRMRLSYLGGAGHALSLGLPVREEPYGHEACEAFFGGLLPESEAARGAIARRFSANARNTFSLLRAIGHECAGAVSLHDPEEPISQGDRWPLKARPLPQAELADHLRELPRKPLFLGVDGLRLSLAGAQEKAAVCLLDGVPAIPLEGTPSTHILKPALGDMADVAANEYLCLTLARAVGLPVPEVELRRAQGLPYLLIARFDRVVGADGAIARVHQEDFCQALGVPSSAKYQADGGPGLGDCFGLTLRLATPALARAQLLMRVAFNLLIGNCDAHGKNFAVLHAEDGQAGLAPAYDLVSTRYYRDLTPKMAMKLGGEYVIDKVYALHWQRFSYEAGLGFPLVRRTVLQLEPQLQDAILAEQETAIGIAHRSILVAISKHASEVVRRLRLG